MLILRKIHNNSFCYCLKYNNSVVFVKRMLNERHRILAEGGIPTEIYKNQSNKWEIRERFGHFGINSGVDIKMLWPTIEEINDEKNLKMYRTISESLKLAEYSKSNEKNKIKDRIAELKKNLDSYPTELEAFEATLQKIEANKSEKEQALESRIREIQEYFGYWIDPKDPRFTVMLKQKELEEKKAAKKAKKEARKNILI